MFDERRMVICTKGKLGGFIPMNKIDKMPELLAGGKLGDAFTSDMILRYIKQGEETTDDYSWRKD